MNDLFAYEYPERPGFKEDGTSREAAIAIEHRAPTLRGRALRELLSVGPGGLTPDEIALRLGSSVLAIRPRITELSRMGVIVKTGERRRYASGLDAYVWTVAQDATT